MRKKLLESLRKKWGVPAEPDDTDPAEARKHFQQFRITGERGDFIDDRTWSDLDMDIVFGRINQTLSIPGEQALYTLLRTPLFSRPALEERSRILGLFQEDRNTRERIQELLAKLGKIGGAHLVDLLWGDRLKPSRSAPVYFWLLLPVPLFIGLGILGHVSGWIGLAVLSLGNAVIHYRTKRKFCEDLPSIRYLGKLIKCSQKISGWNCPVLDDHLAKMRRCLPQVSRIGPQTALLSMGDSNPLTEYLNILFLIEVRAFHTYLKLMGKHEKELREIFESVGFLDAMIAAASYKAGLKASTEPEMIESERRLEIEDAVHPLLADPVPNSISLTEGGILITGSNMSGKTALLKTIGLNVIFAQTLHYCFAARFRASFFNTTTLIGRSDNIIEGKSYYMDEILSLLRIIRASERERPCLCLIDELFRGTNSLERVSASVETLLYLAKKNALIFVTTHDLELTKLLNGAYINYHFREKIGDQGFVFDYRLTKGSSESRNAIDLLRHVGFPEEITDGAERRIRGIH